MNLRFLLLFIFLFVTGNTFHVHAQISIADYPEIEKIKNGVTYVVMNDPNSEKNKEYKEVFKKFWTISKKVEFINQAEITKFLSRESSFFTIDAQLLESQHNNVGNSAMLFYLHLWVVKDSYFDDNKNKEFGNLDRKKLARVALYTDRTFSKAEIKKGELDGHLDYGIGYDFDLDDKIFNWGPGILKNYIQKIESQIKIGKRHNFGSVISNKSELAKLKNSVLYVPDYVLLKRDVATSDKRREEKNVFESYPYQYKLLNKNKLDSIILGPKEIYYVLYVITGMQTFVSVTNSLTGEIIYSKPYSLFQGTFKSKYLKEMLETIE